MNKKADYVRIQCSITTIMIFFLLSFSITIDFAKPISAQPVNTSTDIAAKNNVSNKVLHEQLNSTSLLNSLNKTSSSSDKKGHVTLPSKPITENVPVEANATVMSAMNTTASTTNRTIIEANPSLYTDERANPPAPPLPPANVTVPPPEVGSQAIFSSNRTAEAPSHANATIANATVSSSTPQIQISSIHELPQIHTSTVGETSIANDGPRIFATWNWHAAFSLDNGLHWTPKDPYNMTIGTSEISQFCCDQRVVFDPHHHIFIWFRQGIENSTGENIFRLGVSSDLQQWSYYDVSPKQLDISLKNHSWDLPDLALTNNFLYIKSNIYRQNVEDPKHPFFESTAILRWPLVDLKQRAQPSFDYYTTTQGFNFVPVQGATNAMYWASHLTTNIMRIYTWPESLPPSKVTFTDRTITPFTFGGRGQLVCLSPTGFNWCKRADSRMLGGWISNNDTMGFYWIASQDDEFPYPYVDAAIFKVKDLSYMGRLYLWSPQYAWIDAAISPNSEGKLGIIAFYGNSSIYPDVAVGMNTNSPGSNLPPWQMKTIMNGTGAPINKEEFGDYLAIRPDTASPSGWIGAAFIFKGGNLPNFIRPFMIVVNSSQ